MKLTLVGFIFMYEKVRIFLLNKSAFVEGQSERNTYKWPVAGRGRSCHF